MSMSNLKLVNVEKILDQARIPALSELLQEIIDASKDPWVSNAKLALIVSKDASLVSHIVRVVNTAEYSPTIKIASLEKAVALMGATQVWSTATVLMLMNFVSGLKGISRENLTRLWKHSLATGELSRMLAQNESPEVKEELFLAGIVHELGAVIMHQIFPIEYGKLVQDNPFPSLEVEQEKFGINHRLLSVELLKRWNFSPKIIDIVENHHGGEMPESLELRTHIYGMFKLSDILAEDFEILGPLLRQDSSGLSQEAQAALLQSGLIWDKIRARGHGFTQAFEEVLKCYGLSEEVL